jgi:hypothetical protein
MVQCHRDGAGTMNSMIVLFALSLMIGVALGRFSWRAIALSSLALALVASVVLHHQEFGPLAGIAIIVACLTINQTAYLAGVWFVDRRWARLVQKKADNYPGQRRNESIRHKDYQEQRYPSATAIARRRSDLCLRREHPLALPRSPVKAAPL